MALKNFGDVDLRLLLGNIFELYWEIQYTLAQVTIINTPLAYSQSKYTLRFSSLALTVDLGTYLRQSMQNVPF